MTRLTNGQRDIITRHATEESFQKKEEAMAKEEDKLARKLHASLFDAKELAILKKLDQKWLDLDTCLRFNCGGYDLELCVQGEGLPVPPRQGGYCRRLGNIAGDLADESKKFANKKHDLEQEKAKARRELSAMLYSISTAKKLLEVWPEGKKYYQQFLDVVADTNVPAIQISAINEMLGLGQKVKK